MTEHSANTETHALLQKSQIVHQTSRGPTVDEVASAVLRQALEALYPQRKIDPEQAMIGTPQWQWLNAERVALPTRFESLTEALVRQFFNGSSANYLEGEHFLTLNHQATPVVHMDVDIEAIADLLNDYAPLLFVAFAERQLDYWNSTRRQLPRWQELSDALREALNVHNAEGWDDEQCLVARAISRRPDKQERQRHDITLSDIRVCLIDIDSVDAQGAARHLILGGAVVIFGRYGLRDLVMMYTVEDGYETFDSLQQLGESLPQRIELLPAGQNLQWQLFEPEGNFFDHMAWVLIANQLDAIRAITRQSLDEESEDGSSLLPLIEQASEPQKNTLIDLDDSIPDWLLDASASELDQYSQSINALGQLYRQADKALLPIPPIDTYARNCMREAIIADQPSAAGLPLDKLQIRITNSFESGGVTLPDPHDTHIETLGEYALQNRTPYLATLQFDPPQALPQWLTVAYLTKMANKIDMGEVYPGLIRDRLINDPLQAPLQQRFYLRQLHALLPLIALESKLRRLGGVDEQGYRCVQEWLKPTPGHPHTVVIRPLTFIHAGETVGDVVTNMFIIAPRLSGAGPCLLYRPLLEQPLLQFPSTQNLLYAIHQPGELRDSVLAWLADSQTSFKYAQYTFPIGLPSPWLGAQLLAEPWTSVKWAGPVGLASTALTGEVFPVLFKTHALAMAELADRQSLSNAQRRWALLRDSGWALFNVAANFLCGPAGAAIWVWQSISEIDQVVDAHNRDDTHAQWSAVADMLLNLGMILAHHAATQRTTGPRTALRSEGASDIESEGLPRIQTAPAQAPVPPTVTHVTTLLQDQLPASHYSSLDAYGSVPRRSPGALATFLNTLAVPAPDLTAAAVETLLRGKATLYRLANSTYAQAGDRWFRVIENDDQQVQIVDPQTPSKTGPLLIHNQQGQWFVDTRLRLRGGAGGTSLQSQLKAQRKEKEIQRNQLGAALEAFRNQEAVGNAALEQAQSAMLGASGEAHQEATRRYLEQVEKLIGDYDEALKILGQWRLKGGSDGYFVELQRMTTLLQKNLSLWFVLKRNAYAVLTRKLAQHTVIDTPQALQSYNEELHQALALSQDMIARLQLSRTSLETLDTIGSAGMTTAQRLRQLLPAFNQWDLKSNAIGMSHELCMQETATEAAREATGWLIIEAATATHRHAALIRKPDNGDSTALRIDRLSRLIDVYVDADQRLGDLPGEYPGMVVAAELTRMRSLLGEFRQLAQEQLSELLPETGARSTPATPGPSVAGPSRPVGKVTKSRPRDPAPARPAAASESPLEEMLPVRPAASPTTQVGDIEFIADALNQNERVQAFIDRTRRDALRPNRIPADMQDLFDQQARRLEQIAVSVEQAQARIVAAGGTRLPVGNLSAELNSAAIRLRAQGIAVRASLLKDRQPRQAYLQWLLDNHQVRIVRNVQGRIKTKKRQDYFQEYQILDSTQHDQPLWLAHFHYDSPETAPEQFTAAHLKIADAHLKTLSAERRQALTNLTPIDYVLRRIGDPSLFLQLEAQP